MLCYTISMFLTVKLYIWSEFANMYEQCTKNIPVILHPFCHVVLSVSFILAILKNI